MDIENENTEQGDMSEFLESLQADMLSQNNKIESLSGELTESRKNAEVLDRLRQALRDSGEDPRQAEKIARGKSPEWLDKMLDDSFELEKQGRSVPMTTKLAVETAKAQAENAQLREELEELRQSMKKNQASQTPTFRANEQMFISMDDTLVGAIEEMYGQFDAGVYEAGVKKLSDVLNYIKNDEPEKWEIVRRNKEHQAKIVQSVMRSVVPPAALQALVEKEEESTPITQQHFMEAARELEELDVEPNLKNQVADALRIEYKEFKFNGQRRYNKR